MLVCVFVGENGGSFRIQPFVAVSVVEMPVRIDQVRDWITAKVVGGFQNSPARRGDTSIDEHLAVCAGQNSDVAARALKSANVTPQFMNLDWCLGSIVADQIYNVS